jgi:xanthine dehydrogenase accessory factor
LAIGNLITSHLSSMTYHSSRGFFMQYAGNKAPSRPINEAVGRVLENGSTAMLATLIEASAGVGSKFLVEESGATAGSLGDSELDSAVEIFATTFFESREEARAFAVREFAPELSRWAEARVLMERIEPEPRLVICGAGHVGASLAKLARFIGYRATLIDDRAEFVTRERFSDERIELVLANSWTEAVREAIGNGRGVSVAIVTRGHNEDEECMRAVMTTSPDYVGLIGSKRRTNIVLERLREAGADEEPLRRVCAPIGLDIGAVTPEEVALSILAEIVAKRRGGKSGSLSAWRRGSKG